MRRLLSATALLALLAIPPLGAQGPVRITLPNRPGSVKFMAMGDSGTGERAQYEVADQMFEARKVFPFEFAIMLGDNLYGSQRPADFVVKFERPYKSLLEAGVRFYASLGNHDQPASRYYQPWNMGGERYYTYVVQNVRFFVLDSDALDPRQRDWLAQQLKESTEDWKIAYFHHPLYSSGARHGSQNDLRAVLEPLFVNYGVNAVFSGHDHVYERIKPQKGINYFVSGSAGQLRRGDLRRTSLTDVGFDQDQAFMLVEIDRDTMSVQAITRLGRTVDTTTILRQARSPSAAASSRQ